jgi:hypothetical protein
MKKGLLIDDLQSNMATGHSLWTGAFHMFGGKKHMKIRLVPRLIAGMERISLENLDMCTLISLLVGGLEHLDYFSIYWECHHPN